MSNKVTLPNGSEWDNDLSFRDNTQAAQYWFFETLKLALLKDESVLRCNINTNGGKRNLANMCYSKLHRDELELTCGKNDFYTHKNWPNLIENPIPDSEFFNPENWTYSTNIKFQINEL